MSCVGLADCKAMALMVDGAAEEKKFAADFLDELLALSVKWGRCQGLTGVLFFGTIYNGFGREWGVLGRGWTCVLEEFESFGNVAWH
jgi:hypothetical protein